MTINKSYIICSIGRSGSTLLASTFGNLGNCGNPEEYFHENRVQNLMENNDVSGFRNYLEEILGKGVTDNGVFGMKMHWQLRLKNQLASFGSVWAKPARQ